MHKKIVYQNRIATTLAALTLGVALARLPVRVTGIRVTAERLGPFAACTPGVVEKLETQALALMRPRCPSLPVRAAPAVHMDGRYFGDGYGVATAAAEDARQRFAAAGIALESTYSAKAAAAFLDRLAAEHGPVLFWNTFNSRPPASG
jgi:D-cysteine desulfhydrase